MITVTKPKSISITFKIPETLHISAVALILNTLTVKMEEDAYLIRFI